MTSAVSISNVPWNINSLLKGRELLPLTRKYEIENSLEDSFISGGKLTSEDIPLPVSVSSTIAIAVSCDGRTFATTHGDHTVKVFFFYSNKPYRVLPGHPRTPWTVKYHPTNPNIVASGCLGYQVSFYGLCRFPLLIFWLFLCFLFVLFLVSLIFYFSAFLAVS
jgi:WD40 repeat protein